MNQSNDGKTFLQGRQFCLIRLSFQSLGRVWYLNNHSCRPKKGFTSLTPKTIQVGRITTLYLHPPSHVHMLMEILELKANWLDSGSQNFLHFGGNSFSKTTLRSKINPVTQVETSSNGFRLSIASSPAITRRSQCYKIITFSTKVPTMCH